MSEGILNTSNVNQATFGQIFNIPVDDWVYAEPLYVPGLTVDGAVHNVLYIATVGNSVYAFDADTGILLWHTNYGLSPTIGESAQSCGEINLNHLGIFSTPVIDTSTNTLYFVNFNLNSDGTYHQYIRAIDLITGQDKFNSPQEILLSEPGVAPFLAQYETQRAALTLANGMVYIAWGNTDDCGPYRGWIAGYQASDLSQPPAQFADTNATSNQGGIWMSGNGMVADTSGNLYVATGNGVYDGTANFGDTVLKLSPSLSVLDWFTPSNEASLASRDSDLGSGGVIGIPNTTQLIAGGKAHTLFLMNTGSMGQFNAGGDQVLQEFQSANSLILSTPVFWNDPTTPTYFVWGLRDIARAYSYNGAQFNTTPISTGTLSTSNYTPGLSISANGTTPGSAILWAAVPTAGTGLVPGSLYAFDATNLNTMLYNSTQNAARDSYGSFIHFTSPVVTNGKVYIGSVKAVGVYGLLNSGTPAPTNLTATASNATVFLSWTASSGATSYNVYRATTSGGEQAPALSSVSGTSFTDTTVANSQNYYYFVTAVSAGGESIPSNEVNALPNQSFPTIVTPAAAAPNPVTGTTTSLSVLGGYFNGESKLTYTWSSTGPAAVGFSANGTNAAKNCTATFAALGTYTLTATITSPTALTVSSSVTVTLVDTQTSIGLVPGPTVTLALQTAQQFTATVYDQFGNAVSPQPTIQWSLAAGGVGSINSVSGLYHSGTVPGTATAKAKVGTISTTTAITVGLTQPTVATAPAANPSPVTGTTTNLSVVGAYTGSGGAASLTYTWSSTGPAAVTFSANGTNSAKNTLATFTLPGTYTFSVNISAPSGGSVPASTSPVSVISTLTSIAVSPGPSLSLQLSTSKQFTAVARDQFGVALATQPAFAWSLVSPSVGSIDPVAGLYNSGPVAGSATVNAAVNGISGSAQVAVSASAFNITLTPTGATSISSAYSVSLGNATGGAYTLGFAGQVTAPIAYSASPSVVQAAITSLSTVGAGNATVSGTSGAYTVTFADSIVNASNPLTLSSSLTGGSKAAVTPLINQQPAWLTSTNTANPSFFFNNNYPVQAGGESPTSSDVYGYANAAAYEGPLGYIAADFEANSTQVEIIVKGGAGTLRILVNGVVAVNSSTTATTAGGFLYPTNNTQHNVMIDFGGVRAMRHIRVECGYCVFCGASVGVNDTITPATPTTTARCFVLGESYTQGYSGTTFMTGWDYQIGWNFGWDVWSLGQGGTGYIRTGPAGNMCYMDRVLPPANSWVADIGYSTSGTYTLSYSYGGTTETTVPINYNDTITTIQSDLEALPNVGAGNVDVYGNAGGVVNVNSQIIILFRNSLAGQAGTLTMNTGTLAPNASGDAGVVQWYGDIAPFVPRNSSGQPLPFYIVIASGRSDATYPLSQVQAAAAQLWTGLQSAFPTATIIVVGPWCTGSLQPPVYGQLSDALEAQAAITLPPLNGQTPFVNLQGTITGTGNEATPKGDGDADYYISTDNVHPTDAGHTYIAQCVNNQIQHMLNGAQPWIPQPATANPNPLLTGKTMQVSVSGSDTGGASNLTYTWSATGPGPVTFSPNGTNAAQNSTATFTAAGSYTITAQVTDAALASQSSAVSVTVDSPVTSIAISPASWTTYTYPTTQSFTATALDQFGNPVATQPTFTWSLLSGSVGSINSTTGLYQTGSVPGSAMVKVTGYGVTATAPVVVSSAIPVAVATPASAAPNPVTGTTTGVSVLGSYAGGASNLTYTWSCTGPAAVSFSPNGTNAAQNATATFTAAGSYTLTATITGPQAQTVSSSVNVTVNATATSVAVSPPSATLNVGGGDTFSAVAYDQFGTPLATQPVFTWSLDSGSAGSIGSASGIYAAGLTPGSATVRATSGSISGTASVSVTNVGPSVATAASAAPNPITTGTSTALSVLGADYAGESVLTYTWSATGPAAVTYGSNGTNGAKNTTATFTAAGSYVLTVTIADPYGASVTSTVNVTVDSTLTSIAVSPPSVTLIAGGGDTFSAIAYDQFGTPLATQPVFTWSLDSGSAGSIDPTAGIYAAGLTPGSATVRATSGSISGTGSVSVSDPGPSVATAASAAPNPVTTGTSTALSVLGTDIAGESVLTYTWSATGPAAVTYGSNGTNGAKNTTATFTAAGSYVLTVTIANPYGGTTTSSVNVAVNQVYNSMTLSPGPSISLQLQSSQQFTATVYDQFGNAVSPQPSFTWSILTGGVGSVSSSGLYHSGAAAGAATVRAKAGTLSAATSVTVTAPIPTITTPPAATPNPAVGIATNLAVVGAYTGAGGAASLTYTWSSTGPAAVSFSVNGTNAAKSTVATFSQAGAYTFSVNIVDPTGDIVPASTGPVVVNQTLASIAVSPPSITLPLAAAQQFTAVAYDQFGIALATQPTFAWALVSPSVGALNSITGLYHSGAVTGASTVKAKSGTIGGTAQVTVN